jgi:hypothetical protein
MKLNLPIHQTLSRLPGVVPLLAVALGFLPLTPCAQAAPPVTADLALHLDAAQLTGLNDGDTVNTWTDMSGLGNDAVRTGGTPTYKTGIINGQPVVRFGNNNDDGFQFSRINTIRTVFWVVKENSGVGTDNFLLGDTNSYHFHRGGSNGPLWGGYTENNIRNGTTKLMGTAINGESTSLPSNSYQLISVVTTGNVEANQVTKDRVYRGTLRGDIAEILIYSRALTTEEEESVGSYLTDKYGLVTAYPPLGLTVKLTNPTNNQEFISGSSVMASATVVSGTGPFTVEFFVDDISAGTAVTSDPYTLDLGPLANGSHTIKATVTDSLLATDTSDVHTILVAPASPTTTVLATSGTPSTYGQSVTFTATVSPTPSGGTVQFYDDANPIGGPVTVTAGVAEYTTSALAVATHSISAEYSGFGISLSSIASSLSQTVDQAQLTVSADNKIRAPGVSNPALTYTITGYQNGENFVTADVSGAPTVSTLADNLTPAGTYPITCTTGDLAAANYSFTSADGVLTIQAGAPPVANGMLCWFDASSITGANGDPVTNWDDLSGNGHHATTGGGAVTLATNEVNGLPAVQLRSGGFLNSTAAPFPTIVKEQYVVVRSPNANWNGGGSFFGRKSDVFLSVRGSSYNMAGGTTGFWQDHHPTTVVKNGIAPAPYPAVVNNNNSQDKNGNFSNGCRYAIDDITQYMILKITVDNDGVGNIGTYPYYQIGKNEGTGTMDFDVAEIIGYDHALSVTDEAILGAHLGIKYGISAYVPVYEIVSFGPGAVIDQGASTITWTVAPGTDVSSLSPTYAVTIFSLEDAAFPSGSTRDFTLPQTYTITSPDLTPQKTYTVTVIVATAPPNDDFVNAIDLPGNSGDRSGTGSQYSTTEAGEPNINGATGTVWFKWTAPSNGDFTYGTLGSTAVGGGEWDAMIAIHSGSSVDALTLVGGPQDTFLEESMTVAVTGGTTYYIQAAGFENQAASDIKLTWSFVGSGGTYDTWAAEQIPEVTGGPYGDSDNDSIPNLVEYALNLNPAASDGAPGTLTGRVISYSKRAEAVANGDVTYEIETSPDLNNPWTTVTPDFEDGTTIYYTLPAGEEAIFGRLKVTIPSLEN